MREFDIEFEVVQRITYQASVKANTPEQAIRQYKENPEDYISDEETLLESYDDQDTFTVVGERVTSANGVGSHREDIKPHEWYCNCGDKNEEDFCACGTKRNFGSHIDKSESNNTGGNVMVDYLTLTDGYRIGVTDDVICLLVKWKDENYDEYDQLGGVGITEHGNDDEIDYDGGSLTFIDEMTILSDDDIIYYDVVTLKNGIVFTIDDAQVTVFENYKSMNDSSKAIGIMQRK